jgi:hypothetical protein
MKVIEVHLSRKFNLGNYQTMDVHVQASVESNDDAKQVIAELENLILDWYTGRKTSLTAQEIGKEA